MFNHLPSYEPDGENLRRLEAVPWRTSPGQQRHKIRVGAAWLEPSLVLAHADPRLAWDPRRADRLGHIVTDGRKRAVLYLSREEAPTHAQVAAVAQAVGMNVEVPAKDAPEPPPEMRRHWAPFTGDPIVAYAGLYESRCGHHTLYLAAKQPFPQCNTCGRRVQWRRADD